MFAAAKIPSAQKWAARPAGQHIELGIAENNLFLMLAALGLAGDLFGERLFPIGTVYDPFIARGLDALNYACYQDARFLLVATPSGVTLGPEGGAHQSINPPLDSARPARPAPLRARLRRRACGDDGGGLPAASGPGRRERLSAPHHAHASRRSAREDESLEGGRARRRLLAAGAPAEGEGAALVYSGAIAPEAIAAWEALREDVPGLGLLAITSPDLLHRGWSAAQASRWKARKHGARAMSRHCLRRSRAHAGLVTLLDGAPASLSWLGGVRGQRVSPLGLDRFGQTGSLADLYREYRLDVDAIVEAAAELFLSR